MVGGSSSQACAVQFLLPLAHMDQQLHWFRFHLSHFPLHYTYFSEGQQEIFFFMERVS